MNEALLKTDDAQIALELRKLSDGRMWDGDLVAREILHYSEVAMQSAYEIGRRLLWAKEVLGYGRFEAWCAENTPHISERSRQRYMQLSAYLLEHPKYVEPMARVGLVRAVRLITQAPDQVELLLEQAGAIPEAEIEGMSELSYVEVRKRLDIVLKEKLALATDLEDRERQLAERNAELLAATTVVRNADDKAVESRIADLRKRMDRELGFLAVSMDQFAGAYDKLSPPVRADILGLMESLRRRIEIESLRLRLVIGEDVHGAEWAELMTPYPAASRFPSDGRIPSDFRS